MPYASPTTVTIPTSTKERLAQHKQEGESWRELFSRVADHGIPDSNDE